MKQYLIVAAIALAVAVIVPVVFELMRRRGPDPVARIADTVTPTPTPTTGA